MEIKLTEEQYEKLIKIIYMGMWIADVNEDDNFKFSEIEQLIYSYSTQIPDQKLIEYDQVDQKYYPSEKFDTDDVISNCIETYEDSSFWDELIDRLTKRDMIKKYGLESLHEMTHEEIFEKEKEFIDKYENIFQESGLDKLALEI
jgi:hypothetical protein